MSYDVFVTLDAKEDLRDLYTIFWSKRKADRQQ